MNSINDFFDTNIMRTFLDMTDQRYTVRSFSSIYFVYDSVTQRCSDLYREYDAKHLRNWLNERAAGYPTKLVLRDEEC